MSHKIVQSTWYKGRSLSIFILYAHGILVHYYNALSYQGNYTFYLYIYTSMCSIVSDVSEWHLGSNIERFSFSEFGLSISTFNPGFHIGLTTFNTIQSTLENNPLSSFEWFSIINIEIGSVSNKSWKSRKCLNARMNKTIQSNPSHQQRTTHARISSNKVAIMPP